MRGASMVPWLAAALALSDCLPGDSRPQPATVLLTAEPSEAVTHGAETSDGWKITFERLLMGVGEARLTTDACSDYAHGASSPIGGNGYSRVFDFALAGGPREVNELFGLGSCGLSFRVSAPATDSLLTPGVTLAEAAQMAIRVDDGHAPRSATSVFVKGHASRGSVTKRFEWAFRRNLNAHDCGATTDGGLGPTRDLTGGEALTLGIVIHGEELFRETADEGAPLTFELLAGADADGDGDITLLELSKVPAPPPLYRLLDPALAADARLLEPALAGDVGDGGDAGAALFLTLEDLVYDRLLTKVFYLGDAACVVEARGRRGGGGG